MPKKTEDKLPMYFLSLSLENVKCFGSKQTLDLSNGKGAPAPWTLLLGDNGVGKTTLLELITLMRPVLDPVAEAEAKKKKGGRGKTIAIKAALDDLEGNDTYEQLLRVGSDKNLTVNVELTNGVKLNGAPAKEKEKIAFGVTIHGVDGKLDGRLEKPVKPTPGYLTEYNSPNVFAYSASRHMVKKNITNPGLRDPISNLFSETGDLYDAEEVLLNLEHRALRSLPGAEKLLIKVKLLLVDLLPFVENLKSIDILGPQSITNPNEKSGVQIKMPTGKVPFSALSMGYSTMFAWAVDLALRMLEEFPDSKAPLEEPAVVIIDEIDLHLHPKWQREVRKKLTSHFPNTQFICTAHSPLMAQSSEEENIVVLKPENNEIHIINNRDLIKGWRVDQILTSDLFGITSARSSEVESLVDERRRILDKKKKTKKDLKKLAGLDNELSELPVLESMEDEKMMMNLLKDAHQVINGGNK